MGKTLSSRAPLGFGMFQYTYRSSSTSPPSKKKTIRSTKLHTYYTAVLDTLCPAVDHLHQQHHHTREKTRWASSSPSLISYCTTTPFKDFYLSLVQTSLFSFPYCWKSAQSSASSCMGPEIIMYQMVAGGGWWLVVWFSYSLLTALNQPDYYSDFGFKKEK